MSVGRAIPPQGASRVRTSRRRVPTPWASVRPRARLDRPRPSQDSRRGSARLARPVVRRTESDATTLRLLAELVESGLPAARALATVERAAATEASRGRARIIGDLVRSGQPLSQALRAVGSRRAVVATVAASERVGRLAEGLGSAAELLEHLAAVRRGVRSAMVYPAVIAVLGLGIVMTISVVVLPQFQRSFAALDAELPLATRVLLEVGGLLGRIVSPGGVVFLGGGSLLHVVLRSAWRRRRGDLLVPRWMRPMLRLVHSARIRLARSSSIPIVGRIRTEIDLVSASRIMATMLNAGSVADDALEAAGAGAVTRRAGVAFEAARTALLAGDVGAMLVALRVVLSPSEIEMLTVGHERGLAGVQWRRIAKRREQALDESLRALVSLTEPLLVVAVGLVVGAAVSALYLPTFRILDAF